MRRRLAIFFVAASVSIFGATTCGGGNEDVLRDDEDQAQNQRGQLQERQTGEGG